MMRRTIGIAAVGVALSATTGLPTAAGAADGLACEMEGRFALSPAISRQPSSGALWSPESYRGTCSGTIDGTTLTTVPATGEFSGTFGDGPLSAPQGGATCYSNDGHLLTEMALGVASDRFVRVGGPLYWNRVLRSGVGEGTWDGARATAQFVFLPDQDCATVPITAGTVRFGLELTGDVTFASNAAPALRITAAPSTAGAGDRLTITGDVTDADGIADLRAAGVTLRDANGRLLDVWERRSFTRVDGRTLAIDTSSGRLSGPAPWTVELTASDGAGHAVRDSATVSRR